MSIEGAKTRLIQLDLAQDETFTAMSEGHSLRAHFLMRYPGRYLEFCPEEISLWAKYGDALLQLGHELDDVSSFLNALLNNKTAKIPKGKSGKR